MNLKNLTIGMVAASLLMLGACSSQKDPAAAAVTSAEASLAEIKADASKFAAEELAAVEASVASMKASYDKKDYDKVVADAPTVNSSIDMLKSNVSAKIDQNNAAAAEWATLSTDVPALVQALDSRLSTLSTARRLPKGVDKPGLSSMQADLASMKTDWTQAESAAGAGNSMEAVTIAKSAKAKGEALLERLGMKTG
jgi:hypothetical protein